MSIAVITTESPVISVVEMKDHSRIDGDAENTVIQGFINSAVDFMERETRQQINQATLHLSLDRFPAGRVLIIPRPPLQSVESVQYIDILGQLQTLADDQYKVDTASKPGRIVLKPGLQWPQTDGSSDCVIVNLTAGYTADSLPATLRQAVKWFAAFLFESREAVTDRTFSELPLSVKSIIEQHTYPEAI